MFPVKEIYKISKIIFISYHMIFKLCGSFYAIHNFIRLPVLLMEDGIFEVIFIEAKVLYSYMFNQMGLSYKNV